MRRNIKLLAIPLACCLAANCTKLTKSSGQQSPTPSPTAISENKETQATPATIKSNDKFEPEIVLVGNVWFEEGRLQLTPNSPENAIWSRGDRRYGEPFPEEKVGTALEVDIMNCAGFLARAKAVRQDASYSAWELELIPESVTQDAAHKIKQCDRDKAIGSIPGDSPGFAFALSPSLLERQTFKLEKPPDLAQLYASLPKELKQWLKAGEVKVGDETPRQKGRLNPKYYGDSWADINGDGTVDLIIVHSKCDGTPEDDLTCGSIWYLSNSKWREIAYSTPA